MPQTRLLHITRITLQQIDRSTTIYDNETREPVQEVKRKVDTILPGQVQWGKQRSLQLAAGGADENSEGYIVFRYTDLRSSNITLDLNDRFIKMGHLAVDVYITKLEPFGHYSDMNGPTLVKAYFVSRTQSRQGQGL